MTFVLLLHFLLLERFRGSSSLKQKLSEPGCKSGLAYCCHYSWRLSALSEVVYLYPYGRCFPTTRENAKFVPKCIKFTNSIWKDASHNRLHLGDWTWQENFLQLKCSFYSVKHILIISVCIFLTHRRREYSEEIWGVKGNVIYDVTGIVHGSLTHKHNQWDDAKRCKVNRIC